MAGDSGYVRPGRLGSLVWGYDGDQYDPDFRVSVMPGKMLLNTLQVSPEARGLLLTVFCRYWGKQRAPDLLTLQRGDRLTTPRFKRLMEELVSVGLVEVRQGLVYPRLAFSTDPEIVGERSRAPSRREMPGDWSDLREAVFARDGYACVYCGSGRDLHCDHVHPVVLGGGHGTDNLVTACATCNLSKGSKTVAEWRPDIAEMMRK